MKTLAELEEIKQNMQSKVRLERQEGDGIRILVGMATCGIAAGAKPVLETLQEEIKKRKLQDVDVLQTGCIGVCRLEPIVEIYVPGQEKVTYVKMDALRAERVINQHIVNHQVITEYTIGANV